MDVHERKAYIQHLIGQADTLDFYSVGHVYSGTFSQNYGNNQFKGCFAIFLHLNAKYIYPVLGDQSVEKLELSPMLCCVQPSPDKNGQKPDEFVQEKESL